MKCWVRPLYRKSWSFRFAQWGGVFSLRLAEFSVEDATSIWWRNHGEYGWHIRFFERTGDYRMFSERQGIVQVRKIGPLRIKRLTP